MTAIITPTDVSGMVEHWLGTPVNGYLGSGYGSDLLRLLQAPLRPNAEGDEFIKKLRRDVPVTSVVGAVDVFIDDVGPDKRNIYIQVGDLTLLRQVEV